MADTALTIIDDRDIYRAVGRLQDGLARHPRLTHDNADGTRFVVRVAPDVTLIGNRFLLVPIDTERLWHFDLSLLTKWTAHLGLAVGLPVRYVYSQKGFFYVIDMQSDGEAKIARRLPSLARLPQTLERDRILLGVTERGPLSATRRELRGVIVGGAPRSGKSNLLRSIAYQAACNGWKLYVVDVPNGNTFMPELWQRVHAVRGVTNQVVGINAFLIDIQEECEKRAALFSSAARNRIPPEDMEQYNEWTASRLAPILFIADEFNSFADTIDMPRFEDIARRFQKHGLIVVVGAHSWKAGDISKSFSELLETRICLRLNSREAARAVMPSIGGADVSQIVGIGEQGRAAVDLLGHHAMTQTYYLDPERLSAAVDMPEPERPLTALTDPQRAIAQAVIDGGGRFVVSDLLRAGHSRRQVDKASKTWPAMGWLGPMTDDGRALLEKFFEDTGMKPDRQEQGRPIQGDGRSGRSGDQGDQPDQGQQKRGFQKPPSARISDPDRQWAERVIASARV